VATDDALAEVSMIYESADAERSWACDVGPRVPCSRPGLPRSADGPNCSETSGVPVDVMPGDIAHVGPFVGFDRRALNGR
jgi:hypothetical protein